MLCSREIVLATRLASTMSKRKLLNPYDSPGSSASPLVSQPPPSHDSNSHFTELNPSSTASPAQDSPLPVDPQEELDDQESDADADLDVGDQDENVLIKALSTKIVGLTPLKGANLGKPSFPPFPDFQTHFPQLRRAPRSTFAGYVLPLRAWICRS